MKASLSNETKTVPNQNMQLYLKLLQMNSLELSAFLREKASENPLLLEIPGQADELLPHKPRGAQSRSADDETLEPLAESRNSETLTASLKKQIISARLPEMLRRELLFLLGELDDRGYLPADPPKLTVFGDSMLRYENAVKVFQSLEPAGVGARSLPECLCIQLERSGCEEQAVFDICREHLEDLARGWYTAIGKKLGISSECVSRAKALIARLNPISANGFASPEAVGYIVPDINIVSADNRIIVLMNDKPLPRYEIDGFYAAMAERDDLTEDERSYFSVKLQQARSCLECAEAVKSTLLSCTKVIVRTQYAFFADGISDILPLTMTEIAKQLGLSLSTVSRAIKGKYISCRWGTFPLSKFCAQQAADSSHTSESIQTLIRQIISSEDKGAPLSDSAISEKLCAMGCGVSRRMVAKYREQANIPSSNIRKHI